MADFTGTTLSTPSWTQKNTEGGNVNVHLISIGAEPTFYVNRVFDTQVPNDFVRWATQDNPDPTGAAYPGPGTFGVHTSDYCVESVR
jgi:hypothetical protein